MKIEDEDAVLIKNLYPSKGWGARKLLNEFPDKGWKLGSIDYLLKKIHKMGTVSRQPGSGRPRSARTDESIKTVDDLVLSQKNKPKTHRSTRQISRETGIHCSTVHRIFTVICLKRRRVHQLSEANRVARLTRCKWPLKRYNDSAIDFIWFTDEKCSPLNHHSLRRAIGPMCRSEPRSDLSSSTVCYACARRSASLLWCRLPCQKWV